MWNGDREDIGLDGDRGCVQARSGEDEFAVAQGVAERVVNVGAEPEWCDEEWWRRSRDYRSKLGRTELSHNGLRIWER